MMFRSALASLIVVGISVFPIPSEGGNWSVGLQSDLLLDLNGFTVAETSGVTYLGPGPSAGIHHFAAVEDGGGTVDLIDLSLDSTGNMLSATTTGQLQLADSLDFEGIAYTGASQNTIYVSEEDNPGVREYNLSTGAHLQALTIPSVFANQAGNRGFESLARTPDGSTMWTANEEALTVDGMLSTTSAGSVVRLLELEASGGSFFAGEQYAYVTEPIHPGFTPDRSGLADLVALPDGTVLALERSLNAFGSPSYLTSIYEIDFSAATDISQPSFDSGLTGQSYVPVSKELLWSGPIDGSTGQNLEGLTLGPRLPSGDWVLLGVVDNSNGADFISFNTIVSFTLSANPSADFNEDNRVDGLDLLAWQTGFGTTIGAQLSQGDADRDGDVDAHDLVQWEANYAANLDSVNLTVPEASTAALGLIGMTLSLARARRRA